MRRSTTSKASILLLTTMLSLSACKGDKDKDAPAAPGAAPAPSAAPAADGAKDEASSATSGNAGGGSQASKPPPATSNAIPETRTPDFERLDVNHVGYLTTADVTAEPTLLARFKDCDADGDGKLTRAEYDACSAKP
jgi:hypothetical protein